MLHRKRRGSLCAWALALASAGLLAGASLLGATAKHVDRPVWPTLEEQTTGAHVTPGSALERLIEENQSFELLRPEESVDHLRIPLWLRVLWHKQHPDEVVNPKDPTGGYPLVLHEVYEWMMTHQDLRPGRPALRSATAESQTETGEGRISGAQTSPRSETDIRVNYWNTQKIIGASNDISSTGRQAMFYSSNGGASWSQTYLPLNTGDAFQSDPTVDWTSDGTAWSTTIGINSAQTSLQMRAYKSTDGGATWTFDATFSTGTNNDKQMIWVDHSATSPYKDNLYAIWHNGNPAFINRRTGPTGAWQSPIQVSGSETTGTAIGDDIKTNANGDVFGFFPDTGSQRLNVVKSTNGGASFSAPVRIATTYGSYQISVPADASRQVLIYLTGGAYRTSTLNNVYAAWTDLSGASGCTSGTGPGTNASSTCKSRIWFSRSTDGGSTWSAPVKINDQTSLNDQFFPWLVVDETSGKIAVSYYDTVGDTTRTSTNYYYQSSTDNGVTWTAPFKVTTASTNETTAGADSGNQYGDYTGLSGYASTFFPVWTDRRSGSYEEVWSAAIADSSADFSIAASPTSLSLAAGGSGSSTVSTTASGTFNNSISLSASGMPSGVTVSFNPTSIAAPGTGSSTMTVTVGSGVANGTYPITVTGTGGSTVRTTTVTLTVATPDFSISASPTSVSVLQGNSGSSTITTAVVGGFNNAVSLAASGAPAGVTVSFNPTSIAAPGSGSSTMTLAVASSAAVGTYPITVTGTGGTSTHSTSVSLTVTAPAPAGITNGGFETGNFNGWTSSGSATVIAGAAHSGSYGAQLGTSSPTTDSSIVQTFTLPTNAAQLSFWYDNHCPDTVTYDWATATLKDNVTGTTTTVLAKTCTTTGVWTQVVTNVAASAGHSMTLTLSNHDDNYSGDPTYTWYDDVTITTSSPDFSLSASPTSASVVQGGSGSSTITTAVSGGFNNAITLSASGAPAGVTVSFGTNPIAAPGSGSSTMTMAVASSTATGTYPITVTGTGGSTTHSTTVTLTVTAAPVPDFSLSASPTAVTVVQGNSGSSTISTAALNGFNSSISLSASGAPAGVTVSFGTNPIAAPGSGSSTMTMAVASSTATGTYAITVTGTGGSKTHTATVNLTVSSATAQQLLGNPGFETGTATPWVASSGVVDNSTSEPAHSGSWKAWLDGYGSAHTDTLYQQVAIPSTASTATLTFWLHIDTAETTTTTAYDTLQVQIRNSSGTVLATLATYSNLNAASGYTQKSFNLIAYKGQTIQVYLVGTEDASLQTSFVVDDFALNAQ